MTIRPARWAAALFVVLSTAGAAAAADSGPSSWTAIVDRARGQAVYWDAWAGDPKINAYIAWVADEMRARYGIDLHPVELADTADAVATVVAEKAAGRTEGGKVDLVWINGANFAAMKEAGLLYGPFTAALPNFALVDTSDKPTTLVDFTVPTGGLESPWGMAQLVFYYDAARVDEPPRSIPALLDWARAHPGRFTYPAPPDFTGLTFLKQALIELTADRTVLAHPATEESFAAATAPLWAYLDALHPLLRRGGGAFPSNYPALRQLVEDGEIDIGFAFNPYEASSAVVRGLLPASVKSYVLSGGTIGNTHFVAIPFDANAKEGAMVVANFLLSPEAQARKADPDRWGDPTVLAVATLPPADRRLFDALPRGAAALAPDELGRTLPEPHPSWMTRLADEWLKRYSR